MTNTLLPIIFVGPCIGHAEVREIVRFAADLRPPIKRGDLEHVPVTTPCVAIIDGVFHTTLSVSVQEVLKVLRLGVKVLGCSSMGALRAAELHRYGMIGVGQIFEMYRQRSIDSDAEVALSFNPETSKAVSEPLVNIRYALRCALKSQILSPESAANVLEVAKSIYFYDLTYPHLFRRLHGIVPDCDVERMRTFVQTHRVELDLKRKDAVALLNRLNDDFLLANKNTKCY